MSAHVSTRELLDKVPQVTFWFWLIKILCTTVGHLGRHRPAAGQGGLRSTDPDPVAGTAALTTLPGALT